MYLVQWRNSIYQCCLHILDIQNDHCEWWVFIWLEGHVGQMYKVQRIQCAGHLLINTKLVEKSESDISRLKRMMIYIHTLESLSMRAQAYMRREGYAGLFFFLVPINNLSITINTIHCSFTTKPPLSVAYLKSNKARASHDPMDRVIIKSCASLFCAFHHPVAVFSIVGQVLIDKERNMHLSQQVLRPYSTHHHHSFTPCTELHLPSCDASRKAMSTDSFSDVFLLALVTILLVYLISFPMFSLKKGHIKVVSYLSSFIDSSMPSA